MTHYSRPSPQSRIGCQPVQSGSGGPPLLSKQSRSGFQPLSPCPSQSRSGGPPLSLKKCLSFLCAGVLLLLPVSTTATGSQTFDSWQVLSGQISRIELASGGEVIQLHPGTPVTELIRWADFPGGQDGLTIDLSILPVADSSSSPLSSLNILGARLAFVAEGGMGRLYVLDGEDPVRTDFSFPMLPDGESMEWLDLQIIFSGLIESTDPLEIGWRVMVNGIPLAGNFEADQSSAATGFMQLFGHPSVDVFLGELTVSSTGPDSVLDDQGGSAALGGLSAHTIAEQASLNLPVGKLALADEETGHDDLGGEFMMLSGGSSATIYVSGNDGSDSNDGLALLTAKQSIGAAISAVATGGEIIIAPRPAGAYAVGTIATGGKIVTLRTTGTVTIK